MCYYIKKNQLPILAKENIEVFKLGTSFKDLFLSAFRKTYYIFEKEEYVPEFWKDFSLNAFDEIVTEKGLYSVGNEEEAKNYLYKCLRTTTSFRTFEIRIFKATIPKGSYYIRTEKDYIISDRLIIHNEILDWFPKLGTNFVETYKSTLESIIPNILKICVQYLKKEILI